MNKDLLQKYVDNKCSEKELLDVLKWFKSFSDSPDEKEFLSAIWQNVPSYRLEAETDLNNILNKIHDEIVGRQKQITKTNGRRFVLNLIRNAAAILLIPVLVAAIFFAKKANSLSYQEVFSSVDAITKISLPDGSKVWLNRNSSLKYPVIFNGKTRNVQLKGEGYFEVAHNPKIPFIVDAGELQIKAIGTTLNILAYPDEGTIETSLIEGKVELFKTINGKDPESFYTMKPSELAVYNIGQKQMTLRNINDDRYFAWKNDKLIFEAEPMSEAVKKLSRWFNVDIQISDPELNDFTITATFVHETLRQVMEMLQVFTPIEYTISNRVESADGTFTKREVIIKRSK